MHGVIKAAAPLRFRVGLKTALVALVAASVVVSGLLLHLTWWRTATSVSRDLVGTLEEQIAGAVGRAWWTRVLEIQGVALTVAEGLAGAPPERQQAILITAMVNVPSVTWMAFFPDDGSDVVAIADRPNDTVAVYHIGADGVVRDMGSVGNGAPPLAETGTPMATTVELVDAAWLPAARAVTYPAWVDVPVMPERDEPGAAWIVKVDGGMLAAMMGRGKQAELLGEIPVGKTGRSYVVTSTGAIAIPGDHPQRPHDAALDPVAIAAARHVAARPEAQRNTAENVTLEVGGEAYAVGISPLYLNGWQLAVIIPEREFLGAIERTIKAVALGLLAFVVAVSAVAIAAVRCLIAEPIARVVNDLGHVERFELEAVPRRTSRLAEIDRLSEAIVRMSAGLADFAKYIPTDLVRSLVAEGVRAEPGGTKREVSVLFADLGGFTALAEKLGDDVVPVVSRFLDAASRVIEAEGGTVDKFIGDAVMAFWNAPRAAPDHAERAARAAIGIVAAVEALGEGLSVRVGVQTGPAIVGNVGAASRLSYTALGDTVNQASRLEAANKLYGTAILLGERTAKAVCGAVALREVDTLVLYGRTEGTRVYEPVGPGAAPAWAVRYETALALYRDRRFADALQALDEVTAMRPCDGPARRLAELCRRLVAAPPGPEWVAETHHMK